VPAGLFESSTVTLAARHPRLDGDAMIDLRSDTVTKPTEAMRSAMAQAAVGDDVYGEDPSINALEARTAELLGKEAAVFMPTGTMSNQVALRVHTEAGDGVLLDQASHIIRSESGAPAALSGVTVVPLPGAFGIFSSDDVAAAVSSPHPFNPESLAIPPRLLCVENTHNGGGGSVWPLDQLRAVCDAGRARGLATHMDGARLWHATAASGVSERDFAETCDTVSVCFSKGLGAPVGSALVGPGLLMNRARRFRQMFGGGLRQGGVLAAAALHALEHHRGGLSEDIRRARTLADGLARLEGISLDTATVQSNIVRFKVSGIAAGLFTILCHERGVHMLPAGRHGVRAVVHRDVTAEDVSTALELIAAVLAEAGVPAQMTLADA